MLSRGRVYQQIQHFPPPKKTNQRATDRIPVDCLATMRVNGGSALYLITMLDVSRSGCRICCASKLPEGTLIEVNCHQAVIQGVVRYARTVDQNEFNLGIEAQAASEHAITEEGNIDLTMLFQTEPALVHIGTR